MYNYVNLLLCIIISVAFEIQNYNITQRIPDIYSRPDFPSIVVFGWYNFSLFLAAFILVVDTLFCLLQRNSISCWLPSFQATIFFVAVNFFLSITMSFMSIEHCLEVPYKLLLQVKIRLYDKISFLGCLEVPYKFDMVGWVGGPTNYVTHNSIWVELWQYYC